MKKHVNLHITGRVQGVGFRHHTRQMARMHQLCGFVKNLNDGSVYIEAEGEAEKIAAFIRWCHKGPGFARVEKVETEEGPVKNFRVFEVKF